MSNAQINTQDIQPMGGNTKVVDASFAAEQHGLNQVSEKASKNHSVEIAHLLTVIKVLKENVDKAKTNHTKAPTKSGSGTDPVIPSQYAGDIQAWLDAMLEIQEIFTKIKALAKKLKHMKNSMYGIIEIMNLFQSYQGAHVKALSAIDNLDSDMRSAVTRAQDAVNGIGDSAGIQPLVPPGTKPPPTPSQQAQKLIDFVKSMKLLLSGIQQKYPKLMDKGSIKNLEDALNSIKAPFGSAWGKPKAMAADVQKWVASSKKGTYNPSMKNLQDALQTVNQSTSALSTTTNTSLQYTAEQVKQDLGIEESSIQSYQKFTSAMIQAQKSS